MSEVLSLADLKRALPPFFDIPCDGLGTLRVKRLNIKGKIEILELINAIEKDEAGNCLENEATANSFVDVACRCLVGPTGESEYDNEEGRDYVSRLDEDHFRSVVRSIFKQCGIGSNEEALAEAKND